MNKNVEWPVEIIISIPRKKQISVVSLASALGLKLEQVSPINISGVCTLGLVAFSAPGEVFNLKKIIRKVNNSEAVGFSMLDHFLVNTDQTIPEAWGDGDLYSGDILVNENGVNFLTKLAKTGEKLQFVPIGEAHIFNPKDRLICLVGNIGLS